MVKKKSPEGLFLLHRVSESGLAIVVLHDLVVPVVQESILNLGGGEANGPLTLASGENLLDCHRLVGQDAERHALGDVVGVLIRLTLGVHTLILGVDLVPQSVHISDGLTIDHSDDHFKNRLLHSVVFLSGLAGFPSL